MGAVVDDRMFSLILKNLYSNPVFSVIRELSTNALEAHKLVGNLSSFHIQLPSRFDSNFKIRDFGPGLSREDLNTYLNKLFSTTKAKDNLNPGGFGLT
jgi:HSP90 family molecular chaperone